VKRERDLNRLVYPALGHRPIGEIKRSEIVRFLDQVEDNNGPVMADRTLGLIRKIMNWHSSRSDEFRSPIVRGMARSKARGRERILTDDELRKLWGADGVYGALVRFILLTSARRGEASEMVWSELAGSDWTLPASRNKTKLDLVRPLSKAALAALPPKVDGCAYVFSANGQTPISAFSRLKGRLSEASGVTGFSLHDLRRTARSLMSRAGVPTDHAERCLGHVIGGVRGVYDRHEYLEEKRLAFEALAAQVDRIINPRDNVIGIGKGSKQ
jgi:integrase